MLRINNPRPRQITARDIIFCRFVFGRASLNARTALESPENIQRQKFGLQAIFKIIL